MSIIYSGTTIATVKYGSTTLDKVYYGSTLVYQRDTSVYLYNNGTIGSTVSSFTCSDMYDDYVRLTYSNSSGDGNYIKIYLNNSIGKAFTIYVYFYCSWYSNSTSADSLYCWDRSYSYNGPFSQYTTASFYSSTTQASEFLFYIITSKSRTINVYKIYYKT